MRNVDTKVDGVDSMPAANYNAQRDELENAVLSADITLDLDAGPDTDLNMLGKTIAAYANAGNVYQDSGVADAYVLSITTNLKTVTKYYDNMMVMFKAGTTNTGASTVNVNTLGVKSLTLSDGTALAAGNITAGRYILANYSLSNDRFELVTGAPASSLEYNVYIHATDGDYPTLAAYLAATPVAGDDVFWDVDETFTVGFTVPAGIQITQAFDRTVTFNTAIAGAAVTLVSDARLKGRLYMDFTHAGTIGSALKLTSGGNDIEYFKLNIVSGTVTNVVELDVAVSNNRVYGDVSATGTVTNIVADNSGDLSNYVIVQRAGNAIARSGGASDFGAGTFTQNSATGLTIGSIADKLYLDLGSVTAGDVFIMDGYLTATKGVTDGIIALGNEHSSGTATIESLKSGDVFDSVKVSCHANDSWTLRLLSIFKVTGSGTLIMKIRGTSSASNSTSGTAQAGVSFLRRQ